MYNCRESAGCEASVELKNEGEQRGVVVVVADARRCWLELRRGVLQHRQAGRRLPK